MTGLFRMLTRPSRYFNPWALAIIIVILGLSAMGIVLGIAIGKPIMIAANGVTFTVYLVLAYKYWPWRR
jgi:VIT1/CCC1 family predicted Fe2+/Mn2+ transporter